MRFRTPTASSAAKSGCSASSRSAASTAPPWSRRSAPATTRTLRKSGGRTSKWRPCSAIPGFTDAAQKLGVTSGAQSPLLALLCVASENTTVDDPAVASVFQPVQTVVPAGCTGQVYAVLPTRPTWASLLTLQASLEAISSQPAPSDAAAAGPTLHQCHAGPSGGASDGAGIPRRIRTWGAPVQKLLEDPITNAEGVLRGARARRSEQERQGYLRADPSRS